MSQDKKKPGARQDERSDDSSYAAEYPFNHVTETWSGHQIQIDDTPGAERVFVRHPSGTYTEISADGKVVNFTVGDMKNYNKSGVTFTVDENSDVKIHGHNRLLVGGGAHIEVAGDAGIFAGGDTALAAMGKVNLRASSVYMGMDGDINMNVGGNMNIEAGGNFNMQVAGSTVMNTGGQHDIKASKIMLN